VVQQLFRLERVEEPGPGLLVRLDGALDVSATGAIDEVVQLAQERGGTLTIDLRPVTFVDSSGIRLLLATVRSANRLGTSVRLIRPAPEVQRVFETLCLDTVLPFVDA
jgi:anti-sigma B factor antagonist